MKRIVIIFLSIFTVSVYSQKTFAVSGKILDSKAAPVCGAKVMIVPSNRAVATNHNGEYSLRGVKAGKYLVKISAVGYRNVVDSLVVGKNMKFSLTLQDNVMELQQYVVTNTQAAKRARESSLSLIDVDSKYLKENLGGSLMSSLEKLPGVNSMEIGSGQSKPMVRGLGFNRVVVTENGIKHEAQQWGADHGLEIDQYEVENVEVVKGPASLMYGSDAIGGVIELKNKRVPATHSVGGNVDLTAKSNNDLLGGSFLLYGRGEKLHSSFRVTAIDYADYKVPTDSIDIYSYRAPLHERRLRNTAGKELDLHYTAGVVLPNFQSRIYVGRISTANGLFANAHGLEPRRVDSKLHDASNRDIQYPRQKTVHWKAMNNSWIQLNNTKVELDLGFQRNVRNELNAYVAHGYMPGVFPKELNFASDVERYFDKKTYSVNLKATQQLSPNTELSVGNGTDFQDNSIGGTGFIIPAYRELRSGVFAFAKHTFHKRHTLQVGVRYDYGHLQTEEYRDWFTSPISEESNAEWQNLLRAKALNREFSNLSWSVGYAYNYEEWGWKANVGKSFRMPMAKELAANGVNFHYFTYEVGDANLKPESAYQLDLMFDYSGKKLKVNLSPFVSYFTNYIYLNPTSSYDLKYGYGNQVCKYMESEVLRYGGELSVDYQLAKPLTISLMGEYLYSLQLSGEKRGYTLPFSPPPSAMLSAKYKPDFENRFLRNCYANVDFRVTATQKNIVPPEDITPGFNVMDITLGTQVKAGKQKIDVAMQVKNLMNRKYFNHTSFYRLINVPEAGRNVVITLSMPFGK